MSETGGGESRPSIMNRIKSFLSRSTPEESQSEFSNDQGQDQQEETKSKKERSEPKIETGRVHQTNEGFTKGGFRKIAGKVQKPKQYDQSSDEY
ncbi:MAG TPA: hypothetical protein VL401_01645 [Alphaproteobacteria bacterium]|jgi:hypothetical protein|nr:hypothetical protein [Alphaproteobacteria bacterium]